MSAASLRRRHARRSPQPLQQVNSTTIGLRRVAVRRAPQPSRPDRAAARRRRIDTRGNELTIDGAERRRRRAPPGADGLYERLRARPRPAHVGRRCGAAMRRRRDQRRRARAGSAPTADQASVRIRSRTVAPRTRDPGGLCPGHRRAATWCSAWARPAPARPISRSPRRSSAWSTARSTGSSCRGRRSRPASGWASCRATAREGRSVPAAALRRAVRHAAGAAGGQAAGQRRDRGRAARLHARPHAGQRLRHPRRGAEHHRGADEDVPDPARRELAHGRSPATRARSTCRRAPAPGCARPLEILDGVDGIDFVRFTEADVVRHPLVDPHRPRLRARRGPTPLGAEYETESHGWPTPCDLDRRYHCRRRRMGGRACRSVEELCRRAAAAAFVTGALADGGQPADGGGQHRAEPTTRRRRR